MKNADRVRFLWLFLRGTALILALWTFIVSLSAFLYQQRLNPFLAAVFLLTSYALMTRFPNSSFDRSLLSRLFPAFASRSNKCEKTEKVRHQLPDWPIAVYCVTIGLGCSWACAFLWFSRRYAFVSWPVVGATGVIVGLYGVMTVVVGLLTKGNWRAALLVFLVAPGTLGGIVLRFHLLPTS